jgi:hypothetical protein
VISGPILGNGFSIGVVGISGKGLEAILSGSGKGTILGLGLIISGFGVDVCLSESF